jgi:hypothetical protein
MWTYNLAKDCGIIGIILLNGSQGDVILLFRRIKGGGVIWS